MPQRILFLTIPLVLFLVVPLRADDLSRDTDRQVADADLDAVKAIDAVGGKVVRDE